LPVSYTFKSKYFIFHYIIQVKEFFKMAFILVLGKRKPDDISKWRFIRNSGEESVHFCMFFGWNFDAKTVYRLQFELGAKTAVEVVRASQAFTNMILIRHPIHRQNLNFHTFTGSNCWRCCQ